MAGSRVDLSSDCDWIRGVRRRLSPNQDHRPDDATIDLIVIHAISLPPGEFCTAYVEALFCNQLNAGDHPYFAGIAELRVSAHLLIDRVGVMTQFVAFSRRAWHAGVSRHGGRERCNDFSIGIELEGTDEQPYNRRTVRPPGLRPAQPHENLAGDNERASRRALRRRARPKKRTRVRTSTGSGCFYPPRIRARIRARIGTRIGARIGAVRHAKIGKRDHSLILMDVSRIRFKRL